MFLAHGHEKTTLRDPARTVYVKASWPQTLIDHAYLHCLLEEAISGREAMDVFRN
jgi:hypothetical protein